MCELGGGGGGGSDYAKAYLSIPWRLVWVHMALMW